MVALKNTEVAELVTFEKEIKKKIKEIGKVSDAGERLLQYNELRTHISQAYDHGMLTEGRISDGTYYGHKWVTLRQSDEFEQNGLVAGGITGGVLGIPAGILGGLFLASAVLSGGLAAVVGIGILLGSTALGAAFGVSIGKMLFKHLPADEKHANRMLKLWDEVNDACLKLGSTDYKSVAALLASPQLEKIKETFPKLVNTFNKQAELDEKRRILLGIPAPVVKEQVPAAVENTSTAATEKVVKTARAAAKRVTPTNPK